MDFHSERLSATAPAPQACCGFDSFWGRAAQNNMPHVDWGQVDKNPPNRADPKVRTLAHQVTLGETHFYFAGKVWA